MTPPPSIAGPAPGCQKIILPAYAYPVPAAFWDGGISAADPSASSSPTPTTGRARHRTRLRRGHRPRAGRRHPHPGLRRDRLRKPGGARHRGRHRDVEGHVCGVTDIFFDETASSAERPDPLLRERRRPRSRHARRHRHAQSRHEPRRGYAQVADILNIFEGSERPSTPTSHPPRGSPTTRARASRT